MTLVRKTVTLPAETVAAIDELSGGNFSAFTADALARAVRKAVLKELVDEYTAEHGAFTPEEKAEARRELHGL